MTEIQQEKSIDNNSTHSADNSFIEKIIDQKNDAMEISKTIKELIKDVVSTSKIKNDPAKFLKKILESVSNELDKESYKIIFDEDFFEKLFVLTEKKNVPDCFEILEIHVNLVLDNSFLIFVSKMETNRRIFTNILNYLLTSYEILNFSKYGSSIKQGLVVLLEFLKNHNFFKAENIRLVEIYEKFCSKFKINEEDFINIERIMSNLNKSDIKKYEILNYMNYLLRNCATYSDQLNIVVTVADQIFSHLIKLHWSNYAEVDSKKLLLLDELLEFFDRIIFQTDYYITIDQTYIQETKIYIITNEKTILQMFPNIYYVFGRLMNEILLIPYETKLQYKALIFFRRVYKLFPKLRPLLNNPLNILLTNLSLYSNELKETAIYLYQLLNNSNETDLIKILNNNENLKFAKENKYFSIKATSYPEELDVIYNICSLNLNIFYPLKKKIEAEGFFAINIYVKHDHSLIYWKFTTQDYDISFGIYKVHILDDIPFANYEQQIVEGKIDVVVKNHRVNSQQSMITGATLIINPGLYRLVFDNSYSFWRAKNLFYSVHLLERKRNEN